MPEHDGGADSLCVSGMNKALDVHAPHVARLVEERL
jgi:hypothetical protein